MSLKGVTYLTEWIGAGTNCVRVGGGKESSSWKGEEVTRASQENWELEFYGAMLK